MARSTLPENNEEKVTEKRHKKNNRDDPTQDDGKPRRQKRRTKVDTIEIQEEPQDTAHDQEMKEAEVKVRSAIYSV